MLPMSLFAISGVQRFLHRGPVCQPLVLQVLAVHILLATVDNTDLHRLSPTS